MYSQVVTAGNDSSYYEHMATLKRTVSEQLNPTRSGPADHLIMAAINVENLKFVPTPLNVDA